MPVTIRVPKDLSILESFRALKKHGFGISKFDVDAEATCTKIIVTVEWLGASHKDETVNKVKAITDAVYDFEYKS